MKRPHLVLDTNILVSALLFGGPPREILSLIVAGTVDCSLSSSIFDELEDVLQRPKFGVSSQQVRAIVEVLSVLCRVVNPSEPISAIRTDPDDNRVLECALEARADVIVSGDAHLRELAVYEGIRILNPSEFLRAVRQNGPAAQEEQERE